MILQEDSFQSYIFTFKQIFVGFSGFKWPNRFQGSIKTFFTIFVVSSFSSRQRAQHSSRACMLFPRSQLTAWLHACWGLFVCLSCVLFFAFFVVGWFQSSFFLFDSVPPSNNTNQASKQTRHQIPWNKYPFSLCFVCLLFGFATCLRVKSIYIRIDIIYTLPLPRHLEQYKAHTHKRR